MGGEKRRIEILNGHVHKLAVNRVCYYFLRLFSSLSLSLGLCGLSLPGRRRHIGEDNESFVRV